MSNISTVLVFVFSASLIMIVSLILCWFTVPQLRLANHCFNLNSTGWFYFPSTCILKIKLVFPPFLSWPASCVFFSLTSPLCFFWPELTFQYCIDIKVLSATNPNFFLNSCLFSIGAMPNVRDVHYM